MIHWQNSVAINGPGSSTEYLKDVLEEDRSLQFVNEWLTAVTDHVIGLFLAQVMRLNNLSTKGCFQLGADIGYLVNVTSALGILPHPMLLHFKDIFGDGKTSAVALLHQSNQIVPGRMCTPFSLLFFVDNTYLSQGQVLFCASCIKHCCKYYRTRQSHLHRNASYYYVPNRPHFCMLLWLDQIIYRY